MLDWPQPNSDGELPPCELAVSSSKNRTVTLTAARLAMFASHVSLGAPRGVGVHDIVEIRNPVHPAARARHSPRLSEPAHDRQLGPPHPSNPRIRESARILIRSRSASDCSVAAHGLWKSLQTQQSRDPSINVVPTHDAVPLEGLEPPTVSLGRNCSSIELQRLACRV
jgi:hypothetical protein